MVGINTRWFIKRKNTPFSYSLFVLDYIFHEKGAFLALGKCSLTSETLNRGFTPAAVIPSPTKPEQVLYSHCSKHRRGMRTGTVPSFIKPVLCISYQKQKECSRPFFSYPLHSANIVLSIHLQENSFISCFCRIYSHNPCPWVPAVNLQSPLFLKKGC